MKSVFKQRWVWIVGIFLIINIIGLLKIISLHDASLLEEIKSLPSQIAEEMFSSFNKKPSKEFTVSSVTPRMNADDPCIYVNFSKGVDLEKAKGYVSIKPEIPFHVEESYSSLKVYADYKAGASYTLEILKNMPADDGSRLKKAFVREVVTPDYEEMVKFKVPGMYMSLKGNQVIPVEVMNADKINVEIYKVYENNVVYLLNYMNSYSIPHDLGLDVYEKELSTDIERNIPKDVLIDLKDVSGDDSRGLFFLRVGTPDSYYWKTDTKLVLATDIGIVAKKSGSGLLVWLNSISSTNPVPRATVRVFTKTNQQTLEGTTDENGIVHFENISWSGDKEPYVVTASTDHDLSFIELDKCTLSETAFDVEGRPYISSGYEAFLYTDRGVYRPSETVRLKAILRDKGWRVPESFPVIFEIKGPDEKTFEILNGMLSKYGTVSASLDMPDYALTGRYTIDLLLPGNKKAVGSAKFNIEEFMPDRMKVSISAPDKRYDVRDEIKVEVMAKQFFGAPAKDHNVELICDFKPVEFKPKGFKDYVFTDQDRKFSEKTVSFGEKKTNSEGTTDFKVGIPAGILPPSALECSIQAVVKTLGGRAVTSHIKRMVDYYPYYIGIKRVNEGRAALGEPVAFDYVLVSPVSGKIEPGEIIVEVSKISWSNVLKKNNRGNFRYVSEKHEQVVFEDTIKPASGEGRYEYTPKSGGDYIIRLKGKNESFHTAGVKFYCSGYGSSPWAMERPDRVELSLDKQVYNAGDTATLLIKSPFKGRALITISKAGILSTKAVELESFNREVSIEIGQDFSPNAYCSVTVIRPLLTSQEWVAHRAYGIIPIMINNSARELDVKASMPEKARPGDEVEVDISVKDAFGSGRQAELSVALVDEGILQLTGFKTPDPFLYFYGKRGNSINTYDIYSLILPEYEQEKIGADTTPSAGKIEKAEFDPKKHLNPISAKRVRPVSLWKASVITGENGMAKASFKIPEFTGSLRLMVVAASGGNFGKKESDLKVSEPLMIEPTVPRFLSMGDEFVLPVVVYNKTGTSGRVDIQVETSDGFTVMTDKNISIDLADNEDDLVSFKLKAPPFPQKAKIKISAILGEFSTARRIELAVRPPVAFSTQAGAGSVKAPGKTNLEIPGNWLKGTAGSSLMITSLPSLRFAGGLSYLAKYPYGCIEQTTSCVYPLLYLGNIAALVEPGKYSPTMIESYTNSGIRKILSMQTYSGGFAMWPGYQRNYKWGSIYATDFLVEADKAGFSVPKWRKYRALNYVESLLSQNEKKVSLDFKAYATFVLAKAGRVKQSWIRRLQEKEDKLSTGSTFYLAASLAYLGDHKAVRNILGQGVPDREIERETGGELRSYTKENAIALSVYMEVDPENAMVPVLVKRLESSMSNGNWGTTQDNAQALLALGKYIRYTENRISKYSGTVSIGKNIIAEFDDEHEANIKNAGLGGKTVTIDIKGEGAAYYYWSAEGVPLKVKPVNEDNGIKVRRSYFTKEGNEIDLNRIKQSDVVVVDIAIDASLAYQNVVIEDLLPACFEIENPRLSSTETISWIKKDSFEPDHIDMRDDRLLLFTDLPGTENLHFRYAVRAVTKGDFTLPAINASCMYDPSIKSINGQSKVEVKD